MNVGIIGIGTMGYEIARNFLENDIKIGVFDINKEATDKLAKLGAVVHESPEKLAEHFQYIITIVPNVDIVKSLLLNENGLMKGFHENSMLIDMTSSDPIITKELATIVGENGYRMVDAPVSGGVKKAKDGTLTVMVGGKNGDFDEINPLLK